MSAKKQKKGLLVGEELLRDTTNCQKNCEKNVIGVRVPRTSHEASQMC